MVFESTLRIKKKLENIYENNYSIHYLEIKSL